MEESTKNIPAESYDLGQLMPIVTSAMERAGYREKLTPELFQATAEKKLDELSDKISQELFLQLPLEADMEFVENEALMTSEELISKFKELLEKNNVDVEGVLKRVISEWEETLSEKGGDNE